VVPGGAATVETHGAAIDQALGIERRGALHLRPEADLGVFLGARDARSGLAQRGNDFLGVVADGGYDPHPGHDHSPHLGLDSRLVLIAGRNRYRMDRRLNAGAGSLSGSGRRS